MSKAESGNGSGAAGPSIHRMGALSGFVGLDLAIPNIAGLMSKAETRPWGPILCARTRETVPGPHAISSVAQPSGGASRSIKSCAQSVNHRAMMLSHAPIESTVALANAALHCEPGLDDYTLSASTP